MRVLASTLAAAFAASVVCASSVAHAGGRRGIYDQIGEVREPDGSVNTLATWSAGALIDWYPRAADPVHLEFGFGYVVSGFLFASSDDIGGAASAPGLGGAGVVGHAGVGTTWHSRAGFDWGPLIDFSELSTSNASARTNARATALLMQSSWL